MDLFTIAVLKKHGVEPAVISGRNLSEINLSNKDLAGIDLRGYIITKINLEQADCSGADMRGLQFATANCVSASFIGADLRGANLAFGYFNAADFRGADLRGARLADSLCNECNFSGADLRGAHLGYDHYNSDFRGADLRGISIPPDSDFAKLQCDMRGAILSPEKKDDVSNLRQMPRTLIHSKLTVFDRKSNTSIGSLADVTTQGIKLLSGHPFTIDTVYCLKVRLPKACSFGESFELDARCIWCKATGEGDVFHAGFKIQTISDENLQVLKNLIEEQTALKKSVEVVSYKQVE